MEFCFKTLKIYHSHCNSCGTVSIDRDMTRAETTSQYFQNQRIDGRILHAVICCISSHVEGPLLASLVWGNKRMNCLKFVLKNKVNLALKAFTFVYSLCTSHSLPYCFIFSSFMCYSSDYQVQSSCCLVSWQIRHTAFDQTSVKKYFAVHYLLKNLGTYCGFFFSLAHSLLK